MNQLPIDINIKDLLGILQCLQLSKEEQINLKLTSFKFDNEKFHYYTKFLINEEEYELSSEECLCLLNISPRSLQIMKEGLFFDNKDNKIPTIELLLQYKTKFEKKINELIFQFIIKEDADIVELLNNEEIITDKEKLNIILNLLNKHIVNKQMAYVDKMTNFFNSNFYFTYIKPHTILQEGQGSTHTGKREKDIILLDKLIEGNVLNKESYILYCDINNFKQVNDNISHEAGDEIIQKFANEIHEIENVAPFRIGGDEFILFCTKDSAAEVLNRIQSESFVHSLNKDWNKKNPEIKASISIGVSAIDFNSFKPNEGYKKLVALDEAINMSESHMKIDKLKIKEQDGIYNRETKKTEPLKMSGYEKEQSNIYDKYLNAIGLGNKREPKEDLDNKSDKIPTIMNSLFNKPKF